MDARHFLFYTGEALGNQKMITVACDGDYSHSSTPRVTSPAQCVCACHRLISILFRTRPATSSTRITTHPYKSNWLQISLSTYIYVSYYIRPSQRPSDCCMLTISRPNPTTKRHQKAKKKKRGSIVAFCFDGTWPTPSSTSWISLIFLSSLPSSLHLRGRCWIGFWSSSSSSPLVRFVAVLHLEDTHEKSPMCHSSSMKFRGNALRRPLLPWFSPFLDPFFFILGFSRHQS
jgi:hypothetical protein